MNLEKEIVKTLNILIDQAEERKNVNVQKVLKELLKRDSHSVHFSDISLTECHVLDCIAKNEKITAIEIAKQLEITRGGISKILARLENKGLLTTYHEKEGQKKKFFSLTEFGETINGEHSKLHEKKQENVFSIVKKYSINEQEVILRFLSDLFE